MAWVYTSAKMNSQHVFPARSYSYDMSSILLKNERRMKHGVRGRVEARIIITNTTTGDDRFNGLDWPADLTSLSSLS